MPIPFSLALLSLLLVGADRPSEKLNPETLAASLLPGFVVDLQAEESILAEVNRIRGKRGLVKLRLNSELRDIARSHSSEMAKLGFLSHVDFDRRDLRRRLSVLRMGTWRSAAENLARMENRHPVAPRAVEGWLSNPDHRRNLLGSRYTQTGVGAVRDAEGYLLLCQIFLEP
ncbi:MAG: CAP domain-containing protein [Acidobacteriota bacterium]